MSTVACMAWRSLQGEAGGECPARRAGPAASRRSSGGDSTPAGSGCRRPMASAGAAGVQRTAVRWKVRTAAAVSATAKRATTPRLSDAMAVGLLMPQMSWRPAPLSPASP